ncbi:hypothetical protein BV898_07774 [Hypsibius exemplaris]|uniref:Uncharacterized protein n=1 Tax=Hypsibius exemplaris TaxID=2072580 RepID=A0A1W0WSL2_HYPEX|nr:hypothetical protein BV898_07774 [Hypsibius exemplaris]
MFILNNHFTYARPSISRAVQGPVSESHQQRPALQGQNIRSRMSPQTKKTPTSKTSPKAVTRRQTPKAVLKDSTEKTSRDITRGTRNPLVKVGEAVRSPVNPINGRFSIYQSYGNAFVETPVRQTILSGARTNVVVAAAPPATPANLVSQFLAIPPLMWAGPGAKTSLRTATGRATSRAVRTATSATPQTTARQPVVAALWNQPTTAAIVWTVQQTVFNDAVIRAVNKHSSNIYQHQDYH